MINQGLATENEEGNLAIMRGSRVALKVGKEYGVVEVCKAAVKKKKNMQITINFSFEIKITSCLIPIKSQFLQYWGVTKISLLQNISKG